MGWAVSRGKYRRRRQGRNSQARAAAVAALHDRIADEQGRLQQARQAADQAAALRRRLDRETEVARQRVAPAEADAAAAKQRIGPSWQRLRESIVQLRRVDVRLTATTVSSGHRSAAQAVHARDAGLPIDLTTVHRSAPTGYREHVYQRRVHGGDPELQLVLEGWIPDQVPPGRDALAPYALSTVTDDTPEAGWCWATPPWFNRPDGTDAPSLRAALGANTTGAPVLPAARYAGPPLPGNAALTLPWRTRPLIDDPVDAAALAHWYHRSGWAQSWPTLTDQAADSATDRTDGSSGPRAVPFWVPSEYCAGFADARPLPADTRLRLPFPTIFACFAQPWALPAHTDTSPAEAWPYAGMLYARGLSRTGHAPTLAEVLQRLHGLTSDRSRLPTPLQLVAQLGARVDGLILTADPDGTPADTFAWCVAVPHPWASKLARILIPASRAATAWRTQVDNMIAAIALSCWHPTATPQQAAAALPRRTVEENPELSPLEVRVLDIDTTTATHRNHEAPASDIARRPHLRRGHWRHQRVGDGRRDRRWTWVRPTTVNPSHALATQIYRLPDVAAPT